MKKKDKKKMKWIDIIGLVWSVWLLVLSTGEVKHLAVWLLSYLFTGAYLIVSCVFQKKRKQMIVLEKEE